MRWAHWSGTDGRWVAPSSLANSAEASAVGWPEPNERCAAVTQQKEMMPACGADQETLRQQLRMSLAKALLPTVPSRVWAGPGIELVCSLLASDQPRGPRV